MMKASLALPAILLLCACEGGADKLPSDSTYAARAPASERYVFYDIRHKLESTGSSGTLWMFASIIDTKTGNKRVCQARFPNWSPGSSQPNDVTCQSYPVMAPNTLPAGGNYTAGVPIIPHDKSDLYYWMINQDNGTPYACLADISVQQSGSTRGARCFPVTRTT